MKTAKEEVRKLLERLPDNSSFEDIQSHIYVREKIEQGLQDVKNGRVLSQAEVERRMHSWSTGFMDAVGARQAIEVVTSSCPSAVPAR